MRIKVVRNLCVAVCCFGLGYASAAPLIPTAPGTSWRYNMTEEIGKGLNLPNVKADADGKIRLPVLYRLEGTEDVDGKDLLKFEMHRAGTVTNTDLLTVDEHGITCWARVNLDGELVKFSPPQTMIAAPLKVCGNRHANLFPQKTTEARKGRFQVPEVGQVCDLTGDQVGDLTYYGHMPSVRGIFGRKKGSDFSRVTFLVQDEFLDELL